MARTLNRQYRPTSVSNADQPPVADAPAGYGGQQLPSGYPYQGQEFFGGGPQYSPDYTQSDPYERFKQDRTVIADRGNRIDQSLLNQQVYRQGLENQYRGQADTAYNQLAQTPGYTPDESSAITREGQYNAGMTTPEQYQSLDPTEAEYGGMSGNPNSYYGWFDPSQMYDTNANSAAMTRNAVDLADSGVQGAVNRQRSDLNAAIDPSKLGMSQTYGDSQDAVLNTTSDRLGGNLQSATGRYDAATGNSALSTSPEYMRQAGMTDAEVQQAGERGARDVGLRYQSMMGDADRRAAEAGNASPLASGALKARLAQQSATESADARTDAELAARQQQRGAATGVEQTRLGAEQYRTGTQMQAANQLGQLGQQSAEYQGTLAQNATQQKENTRIGANQYIAGQQANAANQVAGNALQGTQYIGGLRATNEQNIGAQGQNTNQYISNQGTNIAQGVDLANTRNANNLYGIRQGNAQYQQQNTFGQNFNTQNALSRNNQTVADARRQGQQEYRGYVTGQTNNAAQQQNNLNQNRISNYGTQSQGMNQSSANYGNYDLGRRGQSFGTNLKSSLGRSIGSLPTTIATSYINRRQKSGGDGG